MHNSLEVLDHIRLNFSAGGVHILNIALAFIMFGVALDINLSHFKGVITNPKSYLTGLVSQFVLLPALTFLLVILLNLTATVALGMILVAACPGGNISNFMSAGAKGNIALSVTLTATATLLAIFMTPFNFTLWGDFYIQHYNKAAGELLRPITIDEVQVFQTVFLLLGIPVIIGVLVSSKFPQLTSKIKKPIKTSSILFFIGLVIFLLTSNFEHFNNSIKLVFFIVLAHNLLALGTGFLSGTVMRIPQSDRRSLTIETGIQNSGLALALMFNPKIFPPEMELGGMTIIAAWWGIWHIISGLTLVYFWSHKKVTLHEA
ncbi:MAG: bile acid:sodium symporter family protein [Bacteroidales bacterium]|nr:bile acid:sodium symporter family protein [Bacteroidales bacterium]